MEGTDPCTHMVRDRAGASHFLEGTVMLTGDADAFGALPIDLLLSEDEAGQFAALRNTLPEGWVMALQAGAGMAWAAFIYRADAPRGGPMFTVCRWSDRVGLFTRWVDGSACSAMAFTELWPILDGVFAAMQMQLTTVPTEGWADTRH